MTLNVAFERSSLLAFGLSLVLVSGGASAHHSELAEFDPTNPVTVSGKLSKVEWHNPHVWFFVEVIEDDGTATTWGFSTWPPGLLVRAGVTKDTLVIGADVIVEGSRARDGSNNSSTRRLALPDGTELIPYLGAN